MTFPSITTLSLLCHSFGTHEIWSFYHMIEKQYGSSFHKSNLFFWQK